MQFRLLGRTGINVSAIAVGAGPVSGLMTGDDQQRQLDVLERALALGINWIDTAAGYGNGASETNVGRCVAMLPGGNDVHVATKVRVPQDEAGAPAEAIRRSVHASLKRLGRPRITLLQLHNAITNTRGAQAAAITPADVLRHGGVADVLDDLRSEGLLQFIGLTGTGEPDALREVIGSTRFDTIQIPYHLLNPSAGERVPHGFPDVDYGCVLQECAAQDMGTFAIRVFAGGALLNNPPSAHTLTTPYFPLALFEQDRRRAEQLLRRLDVLLPMEDLAVRFALSTPLVDAAIIGFGQPREVDVACQAVAAGELEQPTLAAIRQFVCE